MDPLYAARDPLDITSAEMNENNDDLSALDKCTAIANELDEKQLEKERERKKRQKRARFVGYVRSRKFKRKMKQSLANDKVLNPASVDVLKSEAIPKAGLPYKKYRNEILEIMSQNAILEHRTRVNRRAAQPFNYSIDAAQPMKKTSKSPPISAIKKESPVIKSEAVEITMKFKGKLKPPKNNGDAVGTAPNNVQPRPRRRINYSEELVDEAFMYEQILFDKQKQQEKRKSTSKRMTPSTNDGSSLSAVASAPAAASASAAGNLNSRIRLLEKSNEISITPVKTRLLAKEKEKLGTSVPMPAKAEPLFNITSSVSVHIKPRKSETIESNLRISNITSLHSTRDTPPTKKRKISCKYCQQTFTDEKQLAVHQTVHLKVSAYKLDSPKILHPKLRRVSCSASYEPWNFRLNCVHF